MPTVSGLSTMPEKVLKNTTVGVNRRCNSFSVIILLVVFVMLQSTQKPLPASTASVDPTIKSTPPVNEVPTISAKNATNPKIESTPSVDKFPTIRANATNYPNHIKDRRHRLLIYITTHWSSEHAKYIKYCWPQAIQHLDIFKQADFAVFSTARSHSRVREMHKILPETFSFTNLTIYQYPMDSFRPTEEGRWKGWNEKQMGAALAMVEAGSHGYFDSYEWVVRVNPDVMIRKDNWLLQTMFPNAATRTSTSSNTQQPSLLYVDCLAESFVMHTDFFAFRPAALPPGALANASTPKGAEPALTKAMESVRSSSIQIPGTEPVTPGQCRAVGETVYHKTIPYIVDEECPVSYGEDNGARR